LRGGRLGLRTHRFAQVMPVAWLGRCAAPGRGLAPRPSNRPRCSFIRAQAANVRNGGRAAAAQRGRPVVPPPRTTGVCFKRDSEVPHMHRVMQITSPLRSAQLVRLHGSYSGIACTSPGLNHLLFWAYARAWAASFAQSTSARLSFARLQVT